MPDSEELTLEEQVERIRRRRQPQGSHDKVRRILNIAFLLLAAVGLIWFYTDEQHHTMALIVIASGMVLKIVEFFLRFLG